MAIQIPQEIRTKISQLDDLANEIKEWINDNISEHEGDNYDKLDLFHDDLDELNNRITTFQESQGWI